MNKIKTLWYNLRWSEWAGFIDGWIPRFAFFVPLLGYLIIFNDNATVLIQFDQIIGDHKAFEGLSSGQKLRLIYFGLIFLGISNLIYRIKKPYIFRFGKTILDYTENCLRTLSYDSFLHMHQSIREDGHFTSSGKYYDSEWDGFTERALNAGEGTSTVKRNGHWEDAKLQYGSLLRSILNEHFFKKDTCRKLWLLLCLSLSAIGYILLIIPSLELFLKIVASTFQL